jgi:hypothetical protein
MRIDQERAKELVTTYGAEWFANIRSTEQADRPRAEAAIRALYLGSGRPAPRFHWVPSPEAGVIAAGFTAQSQKWIRGENTRGDIGSGARRPWHAMAMPFDIDVTWRARLHGRVDDRIARWSLGRANGRDTVRAFGVEGVSRLQGQLVSAAQRRATSRVPADRSSPSLNASLVDETASRLLGGLWTSIVDATGLELSRELFVKALERATEDTIRAAAQSRDAGQAMQAGQFDVETPLLAAVRDCFGEPLWRGQGRGERTASIDARLEIARSAGPWWALEGVAVVSERPLSFAVDDRGRIHSDGGPAIAWPDGFEMWAVHGVRVEPSIVTNPERITIAMIDAEQNAEVRRVLVEQFGAERLVREGKARLIHEDETGKLWRREMAADPYRWPREEPVVFVEVLNSTPEPDGNRKTYFLRVPPNMSTAREAVAWTFGLLPGTYQPAVET